MGAERNIFEMQRKWKKKIKISFIHFYANYKKY